jgi:hypothetical protein
VPALLILLIESLRVLAVANLQSVSQRVFTLGDADEMDVVRHKTVGRDAQAIVAGIAEQKTKVEAIVLLFQKDFSLSPISFGVRFRS